MSDEMDYVELNRLLIEKMRVKRRPVAVTFCRDAAPAGYEPAAVVACALVREAEKGRRVYVDASTHDCWVGQYHLGLHRANSYITEGRYLTDAQGFYTPEAAACNKQQSYSLPEGTISALAAAPLDMVPPGVPVDLMICVVDAQRAMPELFHARCHGWRR